VKEQTYEDYHGELMSRYQTDIDVEEVIEYSLIELKDTINTTLPMQWP